MPPTEVYRLLTIIAAGVALSLPTGRPWAAAALAAVLLGLGVDHVRRRGAAARQVAFHPELVYWAHLTRPHLRLADEPIPGCTLLLLHLRDGMELEVGLPPAELCAFVAWLRVRNPTVRLGPYDSPAPAISDERV